MPTLQFKGKSFVPNHHLAVEPKDKTDYSKVVVLETKGVHLKNEDTAYKQSIFELCNEFGKHTPWKELESEFPHKEIEFQIAFDDEWKQKVLEEFR